MQKSLPLCAPVTQVAFHIHLSTARSILVEVERKEGREGDY